MYCRISLAVFLILQAVANAAPSSSGEVGAKVPHKSMRCHVTKTMDRLVGDDVPWPEVPRNHQHFFFTFPNVTSRVSLLRSDPA
ncbi:hypothetical protein KEM48_009058 [Puccinia striiformis f. sp. tritici PST-130]|nr:hypothetical protein KEM48_009058 [Puccinia striiformis f. sp. tritici PST-130]